MIDRCLVITVIIDRSKKEEHPSLRKLHRFELCLLDSEDEDPEGEHVGSCIFRKETSLFGRTDPQYGFELLQNALRELVHQDICANAVAVAFSEYDYGTKDWFGGTVGELIAYLDRKLGK